MSTKVLFLTLKTFSFTGGIEKMCRILTRALYDMASNVNDIKVHSLYDANLDRDSRYITKQQFKGFGEQRTKFVFASIIKAYNSDTVILSHINLLFIAFFIKKISSKTRIVLYAHGIEVWREISPRKRNFLIENCEVWAVSEFTSRKLQDIHQVPAKNITVLPNCLDPFLEIPDHFDKSDQLLVRHNLQPNQPVLFTLSRLSSHELYKGYDMVIENLPQLLIEYPNIMYLLAGQADAKEQSRLEKLVRDLGVTKHVSFVGFIPDEELSDYFRLADIFIMPSRKEGFGIVFIEAAACGCKIIGGDQDGSSQALLNGKLGTLINPEKKEALLSAINNHLEQPRSERSSKAVQELCNQNFNYHQYYRKVEVLLVRN
ncbi:MAG: hypothetical protein JWN56_1406 [Sphingobacteriales bacterium]|nr:hypothetical protein [Sphingobacteriales bacterium]